MKHSLLPLGAALCGALLLTAPAARAQNAPGTSNGMLTGPVVGTAQTSNRREAPPPGLPGARSTDNDPAPADRPSTEMHPNEALFDSINRGDIGGAREALSRGADLQAHNVLGLSPLDLSVDLGRNDITFLLLSMRGATPSGPPPAADSSKAAKPARTAAARPPVARTPTPVRATLPPESRQYADTPGTPVPQAGFLGFGGAGR